jgi:hypothetical protein
MARKKIELTVSLSADTDDSVDGSLIEEQMAELKPEVRLLGSRYAIVIELPDSLVINESTRILFPKSAKHVTHY